MLEVPTLEVLIEAPIVNPDSKSEQFLADCAQHLLLLAEFAQIELRSIVVSLVEWDDDLEASVESLIPADLLSDVRHSGKKTEKRDALHPSIGSIEHDAHRIQDPFECF